MNAVHQVSKRQLLEQPKRERPSSTIQMEPLQAPSIEVHDPNLKSRKGQRAAAKMKDIEAAMESPMTLSGLTEKERRHQKRWLEQEGLRLRQLAGLHRSGSGEP